MMHLCDYWFMFVCVEAVSANSEKIGAEELQCKAMAENAQRDLDEALPALEEAMKVNLWTVIRLNPGCGFLSVGYFVFT